MPNELTVLPARPRRGTDRGRGVAVAGRPRRHRRGQPATGRGRDGEGGRRAAVALRGTVVVALHASAGDLLPVGAPLVTIASESGADAAAGSAASEAAIAGRPRQPRAPVHSWSATASREGGDASQAPSRRRRARTAPSAPRLGHLESRSSRSATVVLRSGARQRRSSLATESSTATVRAKPPVRRLAKQLGVELARCDPLVETAR